MADPLAIYEALARESARMREAARRSDWEALFDAEAACAALLARLRSAPDAGLDEAGRTRKRELLRQVLADDAEIRDRLQPELARLSALIAHFDAGRRMRERYGTAE